MIKKIALLSTTILLASTLWSGAALAARPFQPVVLQQYVAPVAHSGVSYINWLQGYSMQPRYSNQHLDWLLKQSAHSYIVWSFTSHNYPLNEYSLPWNGNRLLTEYNQSNLFGYSNLYDFAGSNYSATYYRVWLPYAGIYARVITVTGGQYSLSQELFVK